MPAKYTRKHQKPEDTKVQKTISLTEGLLLEVDAMARHMGLSFNAIALAGIRGQIEAWKREQMKVRL